MKYYINETGKSSYKNKTWEKYWQDLKEFESFDCFCFSSADFNNPLYERFEEVGGFDPMQFEEMIKKQQMAEISMGCYQYSRVLKDTQTNQLYLAVPQTGFGAYFKIYQYE